MKHHSLVAFLISLASLPLFNAGAAAAILHVKTNGTDLFSGADRALAKQSITNAMTAASTNDEIWVASSRYTEPIPVKPGVALYGRFAGRKPNAASATGTRTSAFSTASRTEPL